MEPELPDNQATVAVILRKDPKTGRFIKGTAPDSRRPKTRGERNVIRRRMRAEAVSSIISRKRWAKIVRCQALVASDPKNRQCVAAATWCSDRIIGPVQQLLQIIGPVTSVTDEDTKSLLLARLNELLPLAPGQVIQTTGDNGDCPSSSQTDAAPTPQAADASTPQ